MWVSFTGHKHLSIEVCGRISRMATSLLLASVLALSPSRALHAFVPRQATCRISPYDLGMSVERADEGRPDGLLLRKSGLDDGIAKTAATAQLGAQLSAQSAVRMRQQQSSAFMGTIELLTRPGCTQCSSVRGALKNLGLSSKQLVERDVTCDDHVSSPDVAARIEHARANGVPQVYLIRASMPDERIGNVWMEIGSGSLMRRLSI